MNVFCPTTHYDFVRHGHADFNAATEAAFAALPDRASAYSQNDIDEKAFEALAFPHMAKTARGIMEERGSSTATLSDADIFAMVPEEIGERLIGALHHEYLAVGNFSRAGRRAFHFADELVARIKDIEVSVPAELLWSGSPCRMFVYDTQGARDALFAVEGEAAPTEGPVTAYVMEYDPTGKHDEVVLGAMVFHNDRRSINAATQVMLSPRRGGTGEEAIAEGAANVPVPSKDRRLMRLIANSILYLSSAGADTAPGLRPSTSSVSVKEMRRLERSTTRLDYTAVGGWAAATPRASRYAWSRDGGALSLQAC